MCMGGSGPEIKRQEPTYNNNDSLDQYTQQMQQQQQQLTAQLQSQIQAANQRTADLQAQLAAEQQALAADAAAQFAGSYNTATETKKASNAETTKEIKPVNEKSKQKLKINTAGVVATPGVGISLGV